MIFHKSPELSYQKLSKKNTNCQKKFNKTHKNCGKISERSKRGKGNRRLFPQCQFQEELRMKKVLVFLMILAAAGGGAFAESGEFSWSGSMEISARAELLNQVWVGCDDPVNCTLPGAFCNECNFENEMWIGGDPGGNTKANVDLAYTRGDLTLGMGFEAVHHDEDDGHVRTGRITLSALYETDRWGVFGSMNLFSNEGGWTNLLNPGPNDLWGYFLFMDGDLRFDASFYGGGNGIWAVSDIVLEEYFDGWNRAETGFQFTYTGIEGLSAGIMLPWWFGPIGPWSPLLNDYVFNQMTVGATYEADAFSVSLMITLEEHATNFHIGAAVDLGEGMDLKFDYFSHFDSNDDQWMAFGIAFTFEEGPLTAGITLKGLDLTDRGRWYYRGRLLVIEPFAAYEINEDLTARLDISFVNGLGDRNSDNDTGNMLVRSLTIEPGLAISVGENAGINLGLGFKLDLGLSDRDSNAPSSSAWFTAGFKWSF